MNIWPPGPCPPTGLLQGDGLDLGVRLLETCYTAEHMAGPVRQRLQMGLKAALDSGDGPEASVMLQALLDSWPVAALVDAGVKLWTERTAAAAVPVLARAAQLLSRAHGWGPVGHGPWPMPDAEWVTKQLPEGAAQVCRRANGDGSDVVAKLAGVPTMDRPWAVPSVAAVSGSDIAAQRAVLARQLVHAEIAAVEVRGPVPPSAEAALALGEFRLEGLAQGAFEQFGVAGLLAPRAPQWRQLLRDAPPGEPGDRLRQVCDTAVLPGPPAALARGEGGPVGWLLWRGPHPAVAVQPEAVALLSALNGEQELSAVADSLGAPMSTIEPMAAELVRIGAASA